MSASSLWVTCGIITQLRARFGAAIRLIREQLDALDLAELREVDRRPRRQVEPEPGPRRRTPEPAPLFDAASTSSLVIRPLRPVPLHLREVDPQLARQPAHGRARVHRAAAVCPTAAAAGGAGGCGRAAGLGLGGLVRGRFGAAPTPPRWRSAGVGRGRLGRRASATAEAFERRLAELRSTAAACPPRRCRRPRRSAPRRRRRTATARPSSPCRTRA